MPGTDVKTGLFFAVRLEVFGQMKLGSSESEAQRAETH
jgi:hypothetical protein